MKKFLSIIGVAFAIVVVCYTAVAGAEVVDPATKVLAFVPVVPAIMRDPATGNEIPYFSRAQKFLLDFLQRKAQGATKKVVDVGGIVFDPITYYIRYAVTNLSGRQKIVSQATARVVGVSNFDQGYLAQFYNFCFDKVSVRYAVDNTSAAESPAAIEGYSSVLSSMAPALRNGELIISLNKNIIVETPITDFGAEAAVTGGGARDFSGGDLQVPKILEENQLIEIELNLAANQSIPNTANTTFAVEVLLHGVQARLRY